MIEISREAVAKVFPKYPVNIRKRFGVRKDENGKMYLVERLSVFGICCKRALFLWFLILDGWKDVIKEEATAKTYRLEIPISEENYVKLLYGKEI